MFKPFSKRTQSQNKGGYVYDELPPPLRVQVVQIWDHLIACFTKVRMDGPDGMYRAIAQRVCMEQGVFQLTGDATSPAHDVCNYFLRERDVGKCLDVIEIIFKFLTEFYQAQSYFEVGVDHHIRRAVDEINVRFREHSIGFEFRDGKMIRIDSGFLHAEAVEPAMALLLQPEMAGANQEFLRAHDHFRHGRYPEVLNECLKAFESTMKAICHKKRWSYNQNDTAKKLLDICQQNGLFPSYVQSSLSGLRSVLESVPTFRNKLSGHGQGVQQVQISEEVAAFVLNSTAANILFLATLAK